MTLGRSPSRCWHRGEWNGSNPFTAFLGRARALHSCDLPAVCITQLFGINSLDMYSLGHPPGDGRPLKRYQAVLLDSFICMLITSGRVQLELQHY